jgi:hypothetical protein
MLSSKLWHQRIAAAMIALSALVPGSATGASAVAPDQNAKRGSFPSSAPSGSQSAETYRVGGIYFFGCDGGHVDDIKPALPIHVGDRFRLSDMKEIKHKISQAVWQTIRCFPTDSAIITNDSNVWTVYIGLPGRDFAERDIPAPPTGALKLPPKAIALYDAMMDVQAKLLAQGEPLLEDDSRGYSLSRNDALRAKEMEVRDFAVQHSDIAYDVLKNSSDDQHRGVAACLIGYLDPSKVQIEALQNAALDPSATVRNNAIRSLGCIASADPEFSRMLDPGFFARMINSGTWTDKNKSGFVLTRMMENSPSDVIAQIKDNSLHSLCDMACWDEPHAASARYLLINATHLAPEAINEPAAKDDFAALYAVSDKACNAGSGNTNQPSLPDLGVILRDVFKADQSDLARTKASECYDKLLKNKELFRGRDLEPSLFDALAFESFHKGQGAALEGDVEAATAAFKYSREHSKHAEELWSDRREPQMLEFSQQWSNYSNASIAYLQNDKKSLQEAIGKCGANNATVKRLLTDLESNGAPLYYRGYGGAK